MVARSAPQRHSDSERVSQTPQASLIWPLFIRQKELYLVGVRSLLARTAHLDWLNRGYGNLLRCSSVAWQKTPTDTSAPLTGG
jgi:hypothetical protein